MQIIHHDEYQYCGYNSLQAAVRLLQEDKKRKCYLWHMGAGAPQIGE